jgi:hopanoid C-3 methylase
MKILMVRPKASPETIGLQHLMVVEPLELEILYASKRAQDSAVIVDMLLEKKPFGHFVREHQPDVLCVTGYITNVSTIHDYCKTAKQLVPKINTIVGGVHCEVCPEDFDHEAIDFRVVRNATKIFRNLLDHIDIMGELPHGVLTKGDSLEHIQLPAFDFSTPLPDRSACNRYRNQYFYIFQDKVALLKTAYGCPYTCTFCFCRIITEGKYFQRPVSDVIMELEQINEKEIYIVDDDFLINKNWLRLFIDEIKKRKIKKHFLVYGRADFIANNPGMMQELAETGLKTVIVGFESFSEKDLELYDKKIPVDLNKEAMRVLQKEKIECYATIIVPPDWDRKDFQEMVRVVKSLGIHFVNLQPLTPLPKTGISFPEKDIILPKSEYDKWDLAHVSVRPQKMSVPDFYREILRAYHDILYDPKVILKFLVSYKPSMLWRMFKGGHKVTRQYKTKIKEARRYA